MICNVCKAEMEEGVVFCTKCGNNLAKSERDELQTSQIAKELEQANNEIKILGSQLSRKKGINGLLLFLICVLLFICIGIGIGFADSKEKNDDYDSQISGLQSKINEMIPNGIDVQVTTIYNANQDGSKISDKLNSSTLKYLQFEYHIFTADNISKYKGNELQIKILKPDGTMELLKDGSKICTSPETIKGETDNFGLGSENGGTFSKGFYTIQFVYNKNIVGMTQIYIE